MRVVGDVTLSDTKSVDGLFEGTFYLPSRAIIVTGTGTTGDTVVTPSNLTLKSHTGNGTGTLTAQIPLPYDFLSLPANPISFSVLRVGAVNALTVSLNKAAVVDEGVTNVSVIAVQESVLEARTLNPTGTYAAGDILALVFTSDCGSGESNYITGIMVKYNRK